MKLKTVFFVVATRGRISTMLRSGLFRLFCTHGWRVVIFSPFLGDESFRNEFGKSHVFFEPLPPIGVWARRVAYVRSEAMRQKHPTLALARRIHHHMTRGFRKRSRAGAFKHFLIQLIAFLILPPLKRSNRFWEFVLRRFLPPFLDERIVAYRPDVMLLASGGAEGSDMPFIIAGNARGVPTVAIDSNTDAATYRYFSAPWRVTHWAFFSEAQKREFKELHGIPDERMTVVGAMRYDHYFRGLAPAPRDVFLKQIGIDPAKRIITLGAKTPIVFPHNEDIINMVQSAIRAGRFGDAVLYVRFDPWHDISRYSKEFLRSFKWERAEDAPSAEHIANLLAHSAVYLGLGATTLAVEACAVGIPSIWIGFDGNTKHADRNDSCRLQYDLPVFRRVIQTGAIPLVESKEELLATIQRFIENPDVNKRERQAMLRQEYANSDDGRAAERIFALVEKLVQ